MNKLKYILILALILVPFVPALAANVVTVSEDVNIELTSPAMTLVLENGSTYSSMTVGASTVALTVSPGGSITLTSNDRYSLHNDQAMSVTNTCSSSLSQVTFVVSSSETEDKTITFTPDTGLCSGSGTTSSSGGGGGQSGSGSSATSTAAPAGTVSVSKTISGASGGSVSTTDNRAGVVLPVGLAVGNVSMNITPKASSGYGTPASGYSAVASQVYDFRLSSGGADMTTFSKAVTLTFQYTDTDVSGINEDGLRVYYRNSAGQWVLVGGTVNKANNTITVDVTHFTIFGVFGPKTSNEGTGNLIKLVCPEKAGVNDPCRSVYYLGTNGKRYVFPNPTIYNSWYPDFSTIKTVASSVMASYPIGGNVTMRPGTYLIKITTDPKVYAVEPGGQLRWVDSEATAKKLYGDNWAKKIVDVADSFFVNYDGSAAVENKVSGEHPVGTLVKYAGSDNVYYVAAGNAKRLFAAGTMSSNGFRNEFVIETAVSYTAGANIFGTEAALNTTAGP